MHVHLNNNNDVSKWNLHQTGQLFVHSLYLTLINNGFVDTNKMLWKINVSLKIKIFMWYMNNGVVLTKDSLAKQKWKCSK
jgi:hypothetical protein